MLFINGHLKINIYASNNYIINFGINKELTEMAQSTLHWIKSTNKR